MDGSTGPEVESAKNCSSPRLHHLLLRSLASPKSKVTSHALTARGLYQGSCIYRGSLEKVLGMIGLLGGEREREEVKFLTNGCILTQGE
jgi:hypothetical protein